MAGGRARIAATALLAAVGVLVVAVEGATLFTVWNLLPLGAAGLALRAAGAASQRAAATAAPSRAPALAFAVAVAAVVGVAHLAWHLDWGGTATGSSTAGLLFVVLPLLALAAGATAWAGARVVLRIAS